MRIAHVITRRELRGAEVVTRDVCRGLQARGHEVLVIGLFQPPDLAEAEKLTDGLSAVDLGGPKRRGFQFSLAAALKRQLAEFSPDVVHAHAFNALKFSAYSKWRTHAAWPLVYRNVGLASQWVTRRGQRLWGRFLLRQVDRVLSVSEASRTDFAATYHFPQSKIDIARQGVRVPSEAERVAAWEQLDSAAGNDPTPRQGCLVHVGSFVPEKNHRGLIEAFETIHQEHPRCRLILIGDGPPRPDIEMLVTQRGLEESVIFLGARSDAATLVAGADLMLLSSHVEGIPGVVLEACAAAVPVVATNVGGLSEIVDDGVSGRLVEAGDMAALAAAASVLLDDAELRMKMGEAAREFVKMHHDFEASVTQLEELYEGLICGK